jgi:flagellar motor protein MotB
MRRASGSSDLSHSFTDLMTSLMVIFILLLLVFLDKQASVNTTAAQSVARDLRQRLPGPNVRLDPKDPSIVIVTIPTSALNFLPNQYQLQPNGERFLQDEMPKIASVLCAGRYRSSIESIIVEGHSDSAPFRGVSLEESQSLNLKLSQDRSMEVVRKTLQDLSSQPAARTCMLEKISASGSGEQDLKGTPDQSRRVVLKVRVNASLAPALVKTLEPK